MASGKKLFFFVSIFLVASFEKRRLGKTVLVLGSVVWFGGCLVCFVLFWWFLFVICCVFSVFVCIFNGVWVCLCVCV